MNEQIAQAIIEGTPNISVTVLASDLKKIICAIIRNEREAIKAEMKAQSETGTLTRKEVMDTLGVSESTLTRWKREKYLTPVKVGYKSLYRQSDINRILSQKTA